MSQTGVTLIEMPSTDDRHTLGLPNSQVILKEWCPEVDSKQLSITAPDDGMRPRVAAEHPKEFI